VLRINEQEAKLVRRIFQMCADSAALGSIAETLNREGIPAPYDGKGYSKPTGHGWARNQVSSMLQNERYVGNVVWNKRQFFPDPLTKKRHSRLRDESDWVRYSDPALLIIPEDLWSQVQARRGARRGRGGRPAGTGRYPTILAGLLRCDSCGGPMSIVGGTVRGGKRLVNYGCSTNHAKGPTACANTKRISERKARQSIVQFAIDFLQSNEFREWVEAGRRRAQEAQERALRADDPTAAMAAEVTAQEKKVERLLDTIMNLGVSEATTRRLKAEEAKLIELRGKLTALARSAKPKKLPAIDVEDLIRDLRSLRTLSEKDPAAARESLQRVVESVVLKPVGNEYEATLALRNYTAAIAGGRVGDKSGCGGGI
jgi:site-specific DNA recombinase